MRLKSNILIVLFCLILTSFAYADNYALIVGGLASNKSYYDSFWYSASKLYRLLTDRYGYHPNNITFLFEDGGLEEGLVDGKSLKEDVQAAFEDLKTKVKPDDRVVIFMVGHAARREGITKFNLPKSDIPDTAYATLFNQIDCKHAYVILAFPRSGSFIKLISKPGWVIITSHSPREGHDGMFCKVFVDALYDEAIDADEDGNISLLEAFLHTKEEIKKWYEMDGSVALEHPHLDDNGDGVGSHKEVPAQDGQLAKNAFLSEKSEGNPAEAKVEKDEDVSEIFTDAPVASDYPDANAIILLETESLDINEDISYLYSNRRIVKIFKESGKRFGKVSIPYTRGNDDITIHHAKTHLPNGQVIELDQKNIIKDIPPPEAVEAGLFVDARLMQFTMPKMTEGCIIDYSYSVKRAGHMMKGEYWHQMYFQTFAPIRKYRFKIRCPKSKDFQYHINGPKIQPKITETTYSKTYEFSAENIPPLKEEKFMCAVRDLAYCITLSSLESWEQLAKWYYTLIKEQDYVAANVEKKTKELLSGAKSRTDKIRRLYEFVATNISYVGIELGIWAIKPHPAKDVLEDKHGDCKDKATLLSAMLKSAGITSYPALISAGESKKFVKEIPTLSYFNHMILVVEDGEKLIWLDPTVETCAYGDLPPSDQNRYAYIIVDEQNSYFAQSPTLPAENNLRYTNTDITVKEDLSISVKENLTLKGSFNTRLRAKLRHINPDNRWEYLRDYIEMDKRARLKEVYTSDLKKMDDKLSIDINYECDDYLVLIGGSYLLKLPMVGHPYATLMSENGRTYPVDIGKKLTLKNEMRINIPDKFEILSVPEDVIIETGLGKITVQYKRNRGKIEMKQTLVLNQPVIEVEQINELKRLVRLASSDRTKYIVFVDRL